LSCLLRTKLEPLLGISPKNQPLPAAGPTKQILTVDQSSCSLCSTDISNYCRSEKQCVSNPVRTWFEGFSFCLWTRAGWLALSQGSSSAITLLFHPDKSSKPPEEGRQLAR
jgi:hypothetical protein